MKNNNIKLEGYNGSWYIIDETIHNGNKYFLLESEIYGEDTASIIINKDFKVILDNVWNGFDDL